MALSGHLRRIPIRRKHEDVQLQNLWLFNCQIAMIQKPTTCWALIIFEGNGA